MFSTLICILFLLTAFAGCSGTERTYDYDLTNYSYSDGIDTNGFFDGITATDYVTLPEYKGLTIPAEVLVADEDDFASQLEGVVSQYDTYEQLTNRAVEDGDTINIDYVGTIDGVEFDNGSTNGAGTEVTIGVTNYIDDFLEQLIGHMPGENFDIEVTFPEDFGEESLNGQDAIFNVTINYIQGELIEAELNDTIAQEYGFETTEELEEDIRAWIVEQQKNDFVTSILNQCEAKGNIPQAAIDFIICADLITYKTYADMFGMELETFVSSYSGYDSLKDYIDANYETYTQSALYCLAIQAIAETEGITVTDLDVSDAGLSDYVESYGMPYIKQYVLQTITIPDFIIDNSVIE